MNDATVDGGTGQFSLHSTIWTSVCVVSLLQPPPSSGRDAANSFRVVLSGGVGVLQDYKVHAEHFSLHTGLKVNGEHLTPRVGQLIFYK